MSSMIAVPIACNLCGKTFHGPRLSSNIHSPEHARQLAQFGRVLMDHMASSHQEVAQQIGMGQMEFQTMMLLSHYRSNDPELQKKLDISRWNLLQKVLSMRFSDETIERWVDSVLPDFMSLAQQGNTADIRRNLTGMLQSMRDQLEEPNKYDMAAILEATSAP